MTCDTACALIPRPMEAVFAFMADPATMAVWNIGTVDVTTGPDGISRGRSVDSGAEVFIHVQPHQNQMLIDYLVGTDPSALTPRIFARVLPGQVMEAEGAVLLMSAMRTPGMTDSRWQGLVARHAEEMRLIKAALETKDTASATR